MTETAKKEDAQLKERRASGVADRRAVATAGKSRSGQQYPAWRFHPSQPARIVNSAEEGEKLGAGWVDSHTKLPAPKAAAEGATNTPANTTAFSASGITVPVDATATPGPNAPVPQNVQVAPGNPAVVRQGNAPPNIPAHVQANTPPKGKGKDSDD